MEKEYLLIQKKVKDLIKYILIMSKQFPRYEKYLLADTIRKLSIELLEIVITINKKYYKKTTFSELDIKHAKLRELINVAYELRYIDIKKYKTSQIIVDEVGKMIGAWIKKYSGGTNE